MSNSSADRLFVAAEGILGLRLPMPPPLEWINAYFLREEKGWVMVDTGYNVPESRAVLEDVIANHLEGLPITRVIATHYHPDHVGQAGWVCAKFDCPLYMTQTEWLLARWLSTDRTDSYVAMARDYYQNAGAPEELSKAIVERGNSFLRTCDEVPAKYQRLNEGDTLTIGDRNWKVMIGRGHAPEMIMLYDEAGKLLISADQVVARITPNISIWAFDTKANPLKDFMECSDHLPTLIPNDVTILPGHGRPFDNFHDRVNTYNTFHVNRLNKLREGLTTEPQSLYQLLKILFPRNLSPRDFVFALGETHSHVNYLLETNEAEQLPGPALQYRKK